MNDLRSILEWAAFHATADDLDKLEAQTEQLIAQREARAATAARRSELEAIRENQAELCSIKGVMYLGDRLAALNTKPVEQEDV